MKIQLLVIMLAASTGFCQPPAGSPSPSPGGVSLGLRSDLKADLSLGDQTPPARTNIGQAIKVTVEVDKTYVAAAWITKSMPMIVTVKNNSNERVTLRLRDGSYHDVTIYSLDGSGRRTVVYPTGPLTGEGAMRDEVLAPGDSCNVDSEMPFAIIHAKKKYQASVVVTWDHEDHIIYSEPFTAPALPAK